MTQLPLFAVQGELWAERCLPCPHAVLVFVSAGARLRAPSLVHDEEPCWACCACSRPPLVPAGEDFNKNLYIKTLDFCTVHGYPSNLGLRNTSYQGINDFMLGAPLHMRMSRLQSFRKLPALDMAPQPVCIPCSGKAKAGAECPQQHRSANGWAHVLLVRWSIRACEACCD